MYINSTTSPSNILFASMEEAIFNLHQQAGRSLIEKTIEKSLKLKSDLLAIKGVSILEANGHEVDPLKINFAVNGFNGGTVREFLRNNYKIDPEVFNSQSVLLSCHIGTDEEAYEILPHAINKLLADGAPSMFAKTLCRPDLPTPDYALSISEAF